MWKPQAEELVSFESSAVPPRRTVLRSASAAQADVVPTTRAEKLIAQLTAIEGIQDRIDISAADFKANKDKYARIDAWTLGELLGIDFESVAQGSGTYWGYRARFADSDRTLPQPASIPLRRWST